MGKAVGIEIKPPFLDPEFMGYSKETTPQTESKHGKRRKIGKWILTQSIRKRLA